MLSVTKKFEFCYGHYLPDHKGLCKNLHGHNAVLEVEVAQPLDKDEYQQYPGMVVDFGDLKEIVRGFIKQLDHTCLNDNPYWTREMGSAAPTAENMCMFFRCELGETSIGSGLVRVRVYETPDSYAEWKAE